MRIRVAPRVTSAAVPSVGPSISPGASRVRSGSAGAIDILTSGNVRILVQAVRAVTEVATVAVRILYVGGSHTNDSQFNIELPE
jgi:hypothetical protein